MITYKQLPSSVAVFLDGKRVGQIKAWKSEGFRYYAKGFKDGGVVFPTVEKVKYSLENDME